MSRTQRIGLATGVAVVVIIVALVLVVVLRPGGASGSVALPDEADGLVALDTEAHFPAGTDLDDEARERNLSGQRDAQEYSADKISEAFDGADAQVRTYAEPEVLDPIYTVIAIAADAGPLLPDGGFDDPERLQIAFPRVDRVEDGEVECLVVRQVVGDSDEDADPDDYILAVTCQRTSDGLTVRASGPAESTGPVVSLVDALWDEMA